jgi:hypothetical protein
MQNNMTRKPKTETIGAQNAPKPKSQPKLTIVEESSCMLLQSQIENDGILNEITKKFHYKDGCIETFNVLTDLFVPNGLIKMSEIMQTAIYFVYRHVDRVILDKLNLSYQVVTDADSQKFSPVDSDKKKIDYVITLKSPELNKKCFHLNPTELHPKFPCFYTFVPEFYVPGLISLFRGPPLHMLCSSDVTNEVLDAKSIDNFSKNATTMSNFGTGGNLTSDEQFTILLILLTHSSIGITNELYRSIKKYIISYTNYRQLNVQGVNKHSHGKVPLDPEVFGQYGQLLFANNLF